MRVVRTNRERGYFVIEMNKPFDFLRYSNLKYIALNINNLDIPPNRISICHTIDRYMRYGFIDETIEEKDIPQPLKDKLKELGITEE